VAVRFAAEYPDAVTRLALYGGYADGSAITSPEGRRTMLDVVGAHWGMGARLLADVFLPDGTAAERDAFAQLQRRASTPEAATESLRGLYSFDVRADLSRVAASTLVLHRRGDRAIPFSLGAEVGRGIPGARFVELEGIEHLPWRGDSITLLTELLAFLGAPVAEAPSATPRVPLSDRESEVLGLVATGFTDAQIAATLVLSTHTVHRHIANIRTKLGVSSRAAAAAWWAAARQPE
jgi:DNA-binding CsgD family transcriptional regulator